MDSKEYKKGETIVSLYLKQKSDSKKAKKELKENLGHFKSVIEKAYERVCSNVGTAGATVKHARKTVGSDLGLTAKQARKFIGSLVQKKDSKSRP